MYNSALSGPRKHAESARTPLLRGEWPAEEGASNTAMRSRRLSVPGRGGRRESSLQAPELAPRWLALHPHQLVDFCPHPQDFYQTYPAIYQFFIIHLKLRFGVQPAARAPSSA